MSNSTNLSARYWHLEPQVGCILASVRECEFLRHDDTFFALTARAQRRLNRLNALQRQAVVDAGGSIKIPTVADVLADAFAVRNATLESVA